jgi:DNA-binding NarL/FixJ family response regulator
MPTDELKEPLERIAKILAGMLLSDIEEGDQKQKIKRLKQCGFENAEIAKMLNTTPNTVAVAVHGLKKSKGKKKKR